MTEYDPNETIENTINDILTNLKDGVDNIERQETKEIYFHEIVGQCIDSNAPSDRSEALTLIDHIGEEEHIDEGLINHSSIDTMIVSVAYECLSEELFNNDFIQELQDDLNNEEIDFNKAQEISEKINQYKIEHGYEEVSRKDSETQIWIENKGFMLDKSDFVEPYYTEGQVIDLCNNSFKILTNSNPKRETVSKNAVVLEGTHRKLFRVYIMGREENIDIRDFFKEEYGSIKEADYNLDPAVYIKPHVVGTEPLGTKLSALSDKARKRIEEKQHCTFDDKKKFLWYINQMVRKLVEKALETNLLMK